MSTKVTSIQRDLTPYRNIGLLITTWSTGERSAATAVLVGRNDVLTAAHAVYNPGRGGWATSVEVYFGADYDFTRSLFQDTGDTVRTTRWSATTFAKQAYADNDDSTFTQAESQYDLALFGIDTAIGDRIGWLPLAAGYDSTQSVEAVGYPSDGTGMMTERITVSPSPSYSLYEAPVGVFGPGSSGGPILVGSQVIGIKSTATWWADIGGTAVYGDLLAAIAANDTLLDARARPAVTSAIPQDGSTTASTSADVAVRFTEMVKRGTGTITLQTASGRTVETFDVATSTRVTIAADTLTVNPTQDLKYFTAYKVVLPDGAVTNLAGQASTAATDYDFYTGGTPIAGTAGDDRFLSTSAVEEFNGGSGTDTAAYLGSVTGYQITIDRPSRTTTVIDNTPDRNGADLLRQVEKLQFGIDTFDLFNPPRTTPPAYKASREFLFDAAYYLLANPAQAKGLTLDTASTHYFTTGAAADLKPNGWFDPVYYANRWSDLRQGGFDSATLFAHYNLYGVWEGRSAGPTYDRYDGTRYLRDNPDVAAYVDAHVADFLGSRSNGAIAHYVIYGSGEGRLAYDTSGELLPTAIVIGVSL